MRNGFLKVPNARIEKYGYTQKLLAYMHVADTRNEKEKAFTVTVRNISNSYGISHGATQRIFADVREDMGWYTGGTQLVQENQQQQGFEGDNWYTGGTPVVQKADDTIYFKRTKDLKPPLPPLGVDGDGAVNEDQSGGSKPRKPSQEEMEACPMFQEFWLAHPRKVGKPKAAAAYYKHVKQSNDVHLKVMEGLKNWKQSENWQKENGKFIPHPTTWINRRGWEDELEVKVDKHNGLAPDVAARVAMLEMQ